MKDLDFDELDRAVSTLMNDVSKDKEIKNEDEQTKTLSISPTIPEGTPPPTMPSISIPPVKEESSTSTPVEKPVATPAAPLAARRGGRFMDVVHTSSGMKKDKAPAGLMSRQGLTIEPTRRFTPEKSNTTVEPVSQTTATQPSASPQKVESHASDWPDPLELSEFIDTPKPVVEPEPTPLLHEDSETPVATPDSEDMQPLSTPFLADTKVEKRPLGSISVTSEPAPEPDYTPVIANSDATLTVDNPNDQFIDEPKKELPPELQGDLVAIESGSASENAVQPEVKAPQKPQSAPHVAALLEAKNEDEPVPYTGPTSIAQQYKEEPNTGDQKNGAIYDTDTYHKPLAHPAKTKSGWLWVLWIILILLIGAGAGAALYFWGIF